MQTLTLLAQPVRLTGAVRPGSTPRGVYGSAIAIVAISITRTSSQSATLLVDVVLE
jgi:hypothetical protein